MRVARRQVTASKESGYVHVNIVGTVCRRPPERKYPNLPGMSSPPKNKRIDAHTNNLERFGERGPTAHVREADPQLHVTINTSAKRPHQHPVGHLRTSFHSPRPPVMELPQGCVMPQTTVVRMQHATQLIPSNNSHVQNARQRKSRSNETHVHAEPYVRTYARTCVRTEGT